MKEYPVDCPLCDGTNEDCEYEALKAMTHTELLVKYLDLTNAAIKAWETLEDIQNEIEIQITCNELKKKIESELAKFKADQRKEVTND